jgi:PAS domain S-box-containing protein
MTKINKKEKIKSANNPTLAKIELISENELSEFAENIIDTVREPLLVLNKELRIVKASRSFYDFFKVNPDETIGTLIYDLGNHQWNIPKLRELLETILPGKTTFDNYEVKHDFSTIGKHTMLLNARQIERAVGKEKIILLAFEDITDRKLAEESLSENNRMTNEYLDILFNHANVPIIIWDASWVITRINDAFENLSGYHWTEIIDKKIDILFPKDKIGSMLESIKNTLDNEKFEVIEIDILTKNNDIRTVLWNSANIFDKEGKRIVATIAQDITKRKRTEETLTVLETRYRRLFESAKDGILILDAETGKIIDVNPFLINLLGYSKEQFIEKAIWDIGFFKDIAANEDKFIELQQKEYVRYENLPLETANGKTINVEFVSNVYLVNNRKVIQCNIRDITERKRAEKEIVMLAHSLKSINECVSITNMEDKILFVNESFTKTYGYEENELVGEYITIVRSPNNLPGLANEILNTTLRGGWQGELWNKRKDGSEFPVYLSTTIINDKDNKPLGLVGVANDITERKQILEELIIAKEKAEQSDKFKSEFLAQISHEIRTPLSAIVGNVDYINDLFNKRIDSDTSDCFDGIDRASKRIIRTVDLILNASELQTCGYKPQLVKVDLNSEILNKLYKEHQLSAKRKGLEIIYICKEKDTKVIADTYSITQIFSNLINNAIKYTKNGKVEILLGKNKTCNIMVEIKDTGIGISKEFLPKIFEPFSQEEQGYTRSFEGNGLGLALVKKYCELNNAIMEVETEKNVGSTFRIIFDEKFS